MHSYSRQRLRRDLVFVVLALIIFIPAVKYLEIPMARRAGAELQRLRQRAHDGNPVAEFAMGSFYAHGTLIVPQSNVKAIYWYRKAAAQGYPPAETKLGGIYENGRGVPRNYATAAYWYHKAAAQGNAAARRGLRRLHRQVSR